MSLFNRLKWKQSEPFAPDGRLRGNPVIPCEYPSILEKEASRVLLPAISSGPVTNSSELNAWLKNSVTEEKMQCKDVRKMFYNTNVSDEKTIPTVNHLLSTPSLCFVLHSLLSLIRQKHKWVIFEIVFHMLLLLGVLLRSDRVMLPPAGLDKFKETHLCSSYSIFYNAL